MTRRIAPRKLVAAEYLGSERRSAELDDLARAGSRLLPRPSGWTDTVRDGVNVRRPFWLLKDLELIRAERARLIAAEMMEDTP